MIREYFRTKFYNWMFGLFVRYGLVKHPYGRAYARENYTLWGTYRGRRD